MTSLRRALLLRRAAVRGCNKLALGCSATRLAAHIVATVSKGSGYALPGDLQFIDARCGAESVPRQGCSFAWSLPCVGACRRVESGVDRLRSAQLQLAQWRAACAHSHVSHQSFLPFSLAGKQMLCARFQWCHALLVCRHGAGQPVVVLPVKDVGARDLALVCHFRCRPANRMLWCMANAVCTKPS